MALLRTLVVLSAVVLTSCGAGGDYCPKARPVKVSITGVEKTQKPAVLKAINGWNRLLVYNYFILNEYNATMWIRSGKLLESHGYAGVHQNYNRGTDLIIIDKTLDPGIVTQVAYHELGHAMGLEHAVRRPSIMFPSVYGSGAVEPTPEDVSNAWIELDKRVNLTENNP